MPNIFTTPSSSTTPQHVARVHPKNNAGKAPVKTSTATLFTLLNVIYLPSAPGQQAEVKSQKANLAQQKNAEFLRQPKHQKQHRKQENATHHQPRPRGSRP